MTHAAADRGRAPRAEREREDDGVDNESVLQRGRVAAQNSSYAKQPLFALCKAEKNGVRAAGAKTQNTPARSRAHCGNATARHMVSVTQ